MFNKECICWFKKSNFDVIKMHGTTIKITIFYLYYGRKWPKYVAITKLKKSHICVRRTENYLF